MTYTLNFPALVFLLGISMTSCNRSERLAERQRNDAARDAHIRECRQRGGFWTPVGGTTYYTVYGCVFPPVR